jgi:hypothetical protein
MNDSPQREDVWAVLEVEAVDVSIGEEGSPVLSCPGAMTMVVTSLRVLVPVVKHRRSSILGMGRAPLILLL